MDPQSYINVIIVMIVGWVMVALLLGALLKRAGVYMSYWTKFAVALGSYFALMVCMVYSVKYFLNIHGYIYNVVLTGG